MRRLLFVAALFALAVPVAAKDVKDKKSIEVSVQFDMPLSNPLTFTTDPASLSAQSGGPRPSIQQWYDLLQGWWAQPRFSVYPGYPDSSYWQGYTSAPSSENEPTINTGHTEPLQASRSAERSHNTGVPWGFSMDFRFRNNLLLTVGYRQSRTTVFNVHTREDFLQVDKIDTWSCETCPWPHQTWWQMDFSRTVRDRTIEHKLRSHYISAELGYDLLGSTEHFTLAPTAGVQLWLNRNRVYTSGTDYVLVPTIPEVRHRELLDGAREHEAPTTTTRYYESMYQPFVGIRVGIRKPSPPDYENPGISLTLDVRRVLGGKKVSFDNEESLGNYPLALTSPDWQATVSLGVIF